MKDFGPLIWESPTAPPAPKPIAYVVSGVFIVVGLLLSVAVVPMLLNSVNDARDRTGGIAGGALMLLLIGSGVWMIKRARSPHRLKGIQFFANGLEYGLPKERCRFLYSELESITFESFDSNPTIDAALTGARLAVSIAAMNPAGIGYALGKLTAEKVESFALICPPNEPEFRVAIFGGFRESIESAINLATT